MADNSEIIRRLRDALARCQTRMSFVALYKEDIEAILKLIDKPQ